MQVQQQGEVRIERINELPDGLKPHEEKTSAGNWIISHSESGHHHTLPGEVQVLEQPDPPEGMKILYAIALRPTALTQTAGRPHDAAPMQPGIYELRISRGFDPFTEEARRVAD